MTAPVAEPPRQRRPLPEPDSQWGWWTVIGPTRSLSRRRGGNRSVTVRCRCGRVATVSANHLVRAMTGSCKWCATARRQQRLGVSRLNEDRG
jgi:hypothetical protein